jgi:hypothetical protein
VCELAITLTIYKIDVMRMSNYDGRLWTHLISPFNWRTLTLMMYLRWEALQGLIQQQLRQTG